MRRDSWLPRDPVAAARVQRWLSVAAGPLAFGPAAARVIELFQRPADPATAIARAHAAVPGDGARAGRHGPGSPATRRRWPISPTTATSARAPGGPRFAGAVSGAARLAAADRGPAGLLSHAEVAGGAGRMSKPSARSGMPASRRCRRAPACAQRMAEIGPRVVRDHMPDQHREFFASCRCVLAGTRRRAGPALGLRCWQGRRALCTRRRRTCCVSRAHPRRTIRWREHLAEGAPVGLLGMQPHTRRRNRMNGRVAASDDSVSTCASGQSFGNCPKYIQPREAGSRAGNGGGNASVSLDALDARRAAPRPGGRHLLHRDRAPAGARVRRRAGRRSTCRIAAARQASCGCRTTARCSCRTTSATPSSTPGQPAAGAALRPAVRGLRQRRPPAPRGSGGDGVGGSGSRDASRCAARIAGDGAARDACDGRAAPQVPGSRAAVKSVAGRGCHRTVTVVQRVRAGGEGVAAIDEPQCTGGLPQPGRGHWRGR